MNVKFAKTDSKRSVIDPDPPYSINQTKSCRSQTQKQDFPFGSKKFFHSPMGSNVTTKISNLEEPRKLSIQYERLFSPENNNLSPYSSQYDLKGKMNFFVPNFKDSDSMFLQKIKHTYEKRFQLVNKAEVKKYGTKSYDEGEYGNGSLMNESNKKNGLINFVQINTSKGDDRRGFFFFFKKREFYYYSVELKENIPSAMEIHRFDFNYFCVYTKGKISPLVIS